MLCDAGVGQLQEDFSAALQDVKQVRALIGFSTSRRWSYRRHREPSAFA